MIENKLIKRDDLEELRKDLPKKEITCLIGSRQTGKTTLMKLLQKELDKRGEKTLFYNLDLAHDKAHFQSQQAFLSKIALEIGSAGGFIFIDEIQRLENAGVFLKGIYDTGLPYKFIISGSGSMDLKAKFKESMAGRKRIFEINPVSLREFINHRTDYRYADRLSDFFSIEREQADLLLLEYMNFGGYPRVILAGDSEDKLRNIDEIYQSYIARDITYLIKADKIESFSHLIRLLADQSGKIINYSELSATIGISLVTLKNYIWYAEETYILKRVTPFFRNIRNEIGKTPMVYFNDHGLRNYALGIMGRLSRPDDIGFTFQSLVYQVLRRKLSWTGTELHFWRSKSAGEVDFVVEAGREIIPVEVKYREMTMPSMPRSVHSFIAKFAPQRCLIVNRNLHTSIDINGCEVRFITLWDLLTEELP
jgi:hypothetical protein